MARAARADWEHVAGARRQRPELAEPLADLALEFQRTHFGHAAPANAPRPIAAWRCSPAWRRICVAEPAVDTGQATPRASGERLVLAGAAPALLLARCMSAGPREQAAAAPGPSDSLVRHLADGSQGRLPAAAGGWATAPSGGPSRWAICAACAWRSCWRRSHGWVGVDLVGFAEWIEAGGTLVYGPSPSSSPTPSCCAKAWSFPSCRSSRSPETQVPLVGDWAPARALALRASVRRRPARETTEAIDLARAGRQSWALVVPRGKGRIYLIDPSVFSNRGLKAADNAVFLAALAARHAGGGTVLFEEFVHGFGDPVSVLSLATWPLRLAAGRGLPGGGCCTPGERAGGWGRLRPSPPRPAGLR